MGRGSSGAQPVLMMSPPSLLLLCASAQPCKAKHSNQHAGLQHAYYLVVTVAPA
jgi:hypothetical protein